MALTESEEDFIRALNREYLRQKCRSCSYETRVTDPTMHDPKCAYVAFMNDPSPELSPKGGIATAQLEDMAQALKELDAQLAKSPNDAGLKAERDAKASAVEDLLSKRK